MRDVIIIGAGAGGPVVAKELAARGLDVLLLEAGPRFQEPEFEWTQFENDALNIYTGFLRFGPADRSQPAWLRETPNGGLLLHQSGVGGTTLRYAANSPRAMPGSFYDYSGPDKDAYDTAHLSPLSYRELIPYYEWVEETLPVRTAAMGTKEEVFLNAAEKMGLALQTTKDTVRAGFRPQENAILQPRGIAGRTSDRQRLVYPEAQGCTFCGHCYHGCVNPHGAPANLMAKRSTNYSYIPMALTADRWSREGRPLTLVTDAFAIGIGTEGTTLPQRARTVTWRIGSTGETYTEESKVIVMAAGAIETPRLWLNAGLPNPNDWVGRGLTDHYADSVTGVMPAPTNSSKGAGSAARADFPGHGMLENFGNAPAAATVFFVLTQNGLTADQGFLVSGADDPDLEGGLIGIPLKNMLSKLDRLLNVLAITDDDVLYENRVTLSTTLPPDEHGPVARVEINARSERSRNNREFLIRQALRLLRAAGASPIHRAHLPNLISSHLHSTMRMGLDDADSVLNKNCETRAVKRLFIADGSALPNALGGPNPTLTIQALATRTAEKIFEMYFGGNSWVDREIPVCSTDPIITLAIAHPRRRCHICHEDHPTLLRKGP